MRRLVEKEYCTDMCFLFNEASGCPESVQAVACFVFDCVATC